VRIFSLLLFFIIIACSQKQETKKYIPDPRAKLLNDSAINLSIQSPPKNFEKAVAILDEATKIDSNYYAAYNSKLTFQVTLNRFNDALITAKNLIRITPESSTAHTNTGFIYWHLGDSVSAIDHFTKANELFDKVLDTMKKSGIRYETALMNKGLLLILIGQQQKGNDILNNLHNKSDETNKWMFEQVLNKSRAEILNDLLRPDTTGSVAYPVKQN
jgi:tetratricopeptide (TPR) repeat protein